MFAMHCQGVLGRLPKETLTLETMSWSFLALSKAVVPSNGFPNASCGRIECVSSSLSRLANVVGAAGEEGYVVSDVTIFKGRQSVGHMYQAQPA